MVFFLKALHTVFISLHVSFSLWVFLSFAWTGLLSFGGLRQIRAPERLRKASRKRGCPGREGRAVQVLHRRLLLLVQRAGTPSWGGSLSASCTLTPLEQDAPVYTDSRLLRPSSVSFHGRFHSCGNTSLERACWVVCSEDAPVKKALGFWTPKAFVNSSGGSGRQDTVGVSQPCLICFIPFSQFFHRLKYLPE